MAVTIVGRGVTQTTKGALLQPIYHTTTIFSDGTVKTDQGDHISWNSATLAAREAVKGTNQVYMIADQVKAFQKRLARAR